MSIKKIYFISDVHLGYDDILSSDEREIMLVDWLDSIKFDCRIIYIVGDLFDYWFEFNDTVPHGFDSLFAKFKELIDYGIVIHYIKGNHDLWIGEFIRKIGINIHNGPVTMTADNKIFHLAHGDGLAGDWVYNMTKSIFTNQACQRLFALIPPPVGFGIMKTYSNISRKKSEGQDGSNKLHIHIGHSNEILKNGTIDYFIMGHYHYPKSVLLSNQKSTYINLGDWIKHFSYAVWDGKDLVLSKL